MGSRSNSKGTDEGGTPASRTWRARRWAAALAAAALVGPAGGANAATITIALSGDTAPDGDGTFAILANRPELNDSGQAAFSARLTGTSVGIGDGIFRGDGGALAQIARTGQTAPDGNGTLDSFSGLALNGTGQTAFRAKLTGTAGGTSDNEGIFRGDGGVLTQIARDGQAAPDGNGTFASFSPYTALNESGQAGLWAELTGTSGGTSDNEGIFRGDGGTLTQIARAGQTAPDANGTFSSFGNPSLNAAGQTAFWAELTGTSGGGSDNQGIFRGDGGVLIQIARKGQAAPDGNGTLSGFSTFSGIALNNTGQAAFLAYLTGTAGGTSDNQGIFLGDGGVLTRIARRGQATPDANGTFGYFEEPALNDSGQAVFSSRLIGTTGGSSDNEGIFRGDGGAVTKIVREGEAAPDGNGTFRVFDDPALNDTGQAAFLANLTGTSGGSSDDLGIFLADPQEILQVARKGQLLEGSTVTSLFALFGHDRGGRSGLNELGQVAYWAELDGVREGIFLFTPELHWRSASSGSWDTSESWTVGIDPAHAHPVFIDPSSGLTVTGPAADTEIDSLTIGAKTSGTATLRTSAGGSLSVAGELTVTARGALDHQMGMLSAGDASNAGTLNQEGGTLLLGSLLNTGSAHLGAEAVVSGLLENWGSLSLADGGSLDAAGGILNHGSISFDGTILSGGDVTNEGDAYLTGGAGDRFFVSGDFLSSSEASVLWDTAGAELIFQGGSHSLAYTGEDRGRSFLGYDQNFAWGVLRLDSGNSLALQDGDATPGGALYVDVIDLEGGLAQIGSIAGNGLSIYYNPFSSENAYLGGQTYALSGGGALAPVPEPATALLLGLGVVGVAVQRRRSEAKMARTKSWSTSPARRAS